MSNNPHFVAYCRCLRELVARKGWDAVDDPEVDRLYDQMDFHWDHLSDDEREATWNISEKLQDEENEMSNQVHQGRWGFYPCDYETYQKLKELHKWYYEAVRKWADWCRWERKEPQNRVIRRKIKDEKGQTIGREVVGPRPEPVVCPHFHHNGKPSPWSGPECVDVIGAYRNARMPKPTPEVVKPLDEAELKELLDLHAAVSSWREKQKKAA